MIFKIYRKIILVLASPVYLAYFFRSEVGAGYGVGFWEKVGLVLRFRRNRRHVVTASNWLEHVQLAADILSVPPETKGDVIECGCYKGREHGESLAGLRKSPAAVEWFVIPFRAYR